MSNLKTSYVPNKSLTSGDILALWADKNYAALANSSVLRQKINQDGDTIVHIMAKNLDKNGFEEILRINPNQFPMISLICPITNQFSQSNKLWKNYKIIILLIKILLPICKID